MHLPDSLNLHVQGHLSVADANRQTVSAQAILDRFVSLPGVILGDEVGMGKTFVALAVAAAHVVHDPSRPVVVMVPGAVVGKWGRDSDTFKSSCLRDPQERDRFRVRTAETGVDFLKLLDDPAETRATVIVLAHGALNRRLADKWVKLAVLQASIKGRHGVGALRVRLARFAPLVLRQTKKVGEKYELFLKLLEAPASDWKRILVREHMLLETDDDPVPQVFLDALDGLNLSDVFTRVVDVIPERTSAQVDQRIRQARTALDSADKGVLPAIWRAALKRMQLSMPLLVLDEAHRVRNAGTQLAALLAETRDDLDTAGGQLSERFDRMLFLTATPFQLGHAELRNVLTRFGAINWTGASAPSMSRDVFNGALIELHQKLDAMQMDTERLESAWKRIVALDLEEAKRNYGDLWWKKACIGPDHACLSVSNERIRRVMLAFYRAQESIQAAEQCLKPWVLRSARSPCLPLPFQGVARRVRVEGAAILKECDDRRNDGDCDQGGGLRVSARNALPFLLAARITTLPGSRRVFSEGIASSYEALLDTYREETSSDALADDLGTAADARVLWYEARLRASAKSLNSDGPDLHPKVKATVDLAMSLWRKGEKVLIFCHYRRTGSALHRYLSEAMLKEIEVRACEQLGCGPAEVSSELRRIADGFDRDRPAARAAAAILDEMLTEYLMLRDAEIRDGVLEIVLRFLRTPTFLVRFGGLSLKGESQDWVSDLFSSKDSSGMSLRDVIGQFLDFLSKRTTNQDRLAYLTALQSLQTGTHAGPEVADSFSDDEAGDGERSRLVANVRRVYGETRPETRQKIMLTFNTPFYPEILIASSVMAEGVDLHLNCRHVIHHDLDWNPSSLEQRTGRIDRLGAKAERSGQSIRVYLPYVEGCQDEKLFRVVMDRERWFGVVMGAEESMARILKASAWDVERMANEVPVPSSMVDDLRLRLAAQ
jgi:ERCC4-related helicase